MLQRLYFSIVFLVAPLTVASAETDVPIAKFSGHNSEQTVEFDVKAPWLVDFEVNSEFPDLATTVIRLEDTSDQTIGTVAGFRGTGRGLKLFRTSGRYRLDIASETTEWRIEITEISEAWANRLEQMTATARSDRPKSSELQRQVSANSFRGWHAESDRSLILTGTGTTNFRVSFGGDGCPGLAAAKTLSFMTPDKGPLDMYDSILLDDGTRCYFEKLTWIAR